MPEWVVLIAVVAAYFAIVRWILPRFGVAT
jgi:hypothetical protein